MCRGREDFSPHVTASGPDITQPAAGRAWHSLRWTGCQTPQGQAFRESVGPPWDSARSPRMRMMRRFGHVEANDAFRRPPLGVWLQPDDHWFAVHFATAI